MKSLETRWIHRVGCSWIVIAVVVAAAGLVSPGSAAAATDAGSGTTHHFIAASHRISAESLSAPLTSANAAVANVQTNVEDTFTGYPVTLDTGCGNSATFVCFTMAGLGGFRLIPSPPLSSGTVYQNPLVIVSMDGQSCGYLQGDPYDSWVEVDQFAISQGAVSVFAAQFSCVTAKVAISGTIAYRMTNSTPHKGYYLYDSFGDTASFGNDGYLNYLGNPSYGNLNQPIVGMATTPDAAGYWMTASDGGVFSFGDANFYGSTGNIRLNKSIVGMAATPDGRGYWFVASDGGIFAFGDAHFYGSTGNIRLNRPIVGMAATPDGRGYWLVASDGGIFAFGDARFYGSTGNIRLNRPIVGMAATPDGRGYWFVASDGGVFSFGDAHFYGSTGGIHLVQPITGMLPSPDGRGYLMVARDGGVFTFGDATFQGSLGGQGTTEVAGVTR
jgi:ribosomal protein L24E